VAIFLDGGASSTDPTKMGYGAKIVVLLLVLIIVGWQWVLWFMARVKKKQIKSSYPQKNTS
jgi:uncharacterized ion transporter superfamily protein YfcC